jgi:hypothetical protein
MYIDAVYWPPELSRLLKFVFNNFLSTFKGLYGSLNLNFKIDIILHIIYDIT